MRKIAFSLYAAGVLWAQLAFAVNPDEVLADPALEARARAISAELRCLVCQNQSIDDSNAGIARDLRLIVRERLMAGDSDQQVTEFVVSRFGNFALLNPPVQQNTVLLWIAPALLLAVSVSVLAGYLKRNRLPIQEDLQ